MLIMPDVRVMNNYTGTGPQQTTTGCSQTSNIIKDVDCELSLRFEASWLDGSETSRRTGSMLILISDGSTVLSAKKYLFEHIFGRFRFCNGIFHRCCTADEPIGAVGSFRDKFV